MDSSGSSVRRAAVAGQFYPGSAKGVARAVREAMGEGPVRRALGVMVPHAGYIYSGSIAGQVYAAVELPRKFVILGPNHTGMGAPVSIMTSGSWETPAGECAIDGVLARAIVAASGNIVEDDAAHVYEHSIEVQLPFLQYLLEDFEFVPIIMMVNDIDSCREVGTAVAAAIKQQPETVLVIASSDMNHFESQEISERKDKLALDRVLAMDPEGLLETVQSNDISMCGVAPAAAMLFACASLGATGAELVGYANSGHVSGDYSQVVGYAGVVVS